MAGTTKKTCPHRELPYCHVNEVYVDGRLVDVCIYCIHSKISGRTAFKLPLSEFPNDLLLSGDPRLNTEMRISAAALHYPIVVSTRGHIIDGCHRIVKARRQSMLSIQAVSMNDEEILLCVY